jgi:hypothetical protein
MISAGKVSFLESINLLIEFREIMRKVRSERDNGETSGQYLPYTFEEML